MFSFPWHLKIREEFFQIFWWSQFLEPCLGGLRLAWVRSVEKKKKNEYQCAAKKRFCKTRHFWTKARTYKIFLFHTLQNVRWLSTILYCSQWHLCLEKFQEKNRSSQNQREASTTSLEPGTSRTRVTMHCHYTNHSIRCQRSTFIVHLSTVLTPNQP